MRRACWAAVDMSAAKDRKVQIIKWSTLSEHIAHSTAVTNLPGAQMPSITQPGRPLQMSAVLSVHRWCAQKKACWQRTCLSEERA